MCVEVGARGFLANSLNYMIRLRINNKEARKMKSEISLTALRGSYAIYLQRKAKSFVKWDFRYIYHFYNLSFKNQYIINHHCRS